MKKVVTGLGLAAVLVAGKLIWSVVVAHKLPAPVSPQELAEQVDEWVEHDLALEGADEARAWLAKTEHELYEGDREEAVAVVERLYAAGAQGIWFVGVEELDGITVADEIAIRMPEEPQARQRLLAVYDQLWDDVPTPDNGQEYLTYVFY